LSDCDILVVYSLIEISLWASVFLSKLCVVDGVCVSFLLRHGDDWQITGSLCTNAYRHQRLLHGIEEHVIDAS